MKDNCAFVSAYTPNFSDQAEIAIDMMGRYCERNGHDYFIEQTPPGNHPMYFKYEMVKRHLKDHAYTIWVDLDCCVCDMDFNIVGALKEWGTPATNIWVAQDWNGVCCCFFALKNTDWAYDFTCGMLVWEDQWRHMQDPNLTRLMRSCDQTDQLIMKSFHALHLRHRWRFSLLPYSVVTERASRPWPRPFMWHVGPRPLELMKQTRTAVLEDKFEEMAMAYEPMIHGIRFDP
jgi:hypothetical protein